MDSPNLVEDLGCKSLRINTNQTFLRSRESGSELVEYRMDVEKYSAKKTERRMGRT